MDLMLRRRTLMQFGPQPNEYIQDGLVLFLDGLNQGNTNNRWIDVKGNRSFTLTNCTKLTNGVRFNGTSSYGSLSSNNLGLSYDQGTAEFAAYYNGPSYGSDCAIIYQGRYSSSVPYMLIAGIRPDTNYRTVAYNNMICYGSGIDHKRWYGFGTNNGNHVVSLSETRAVDNGASLTERFGFGGTTASTSNGLTIGYRNSSSRMYFKGDIFAIRLYNRILSREEMLHNQRLDNERYGLGLDLLNDFNANYIPKASLINTSDAYIKVPLTPQEGDYVSVFYSLSGQAGNLNTIYSCGTATNQLFLQLAGNRTKSYGRYFSSTDLQFDTNISADTYYGASCFPNKVYDGSKSVNCAYEGAIDGTDTNLYIFRKSDLTGPFIGKMKTVSVANNNAIRLFLIPCVRRIDGKAGMYDAVSKTFYSSLSNNDFTAE